MEELLYNPVYNALLTRDAHLGEGTDSVRYFHEEVSPFVGFEEGNDRGFEELHELLPEGRKILYATPKWIDKPAGWQVLVAIEGLQFVFAGKSMERNAAIQSVPLATKDVEEMMKLAALTKPGPFGSRTIDFGHYYGIFDKGQLVAMTGQRMHIPGYSEISAVCTHPDHLGKGYAAALIAQQVELIHAQGQEAFLHVRGDNDRAIGLYERLGFRVSRGMNFWFMRREG